MFSLFSGKKLSHTGRKHSRREMKKNQDTQRAMLDMNCGTDERGIPQGPGEILKDTEQQLEFKGRQEK